MDDDLKAVVERVGEIAAAVEFDKGDGLTFSEGGAVKHAADLRTLLSALRQRDEALRRIRDLDTRSHHDGYDNGPGGGFYVYRDVIFADEAFPIIDAILTGSETNAR